MSFIEENRSILRLLVRSPIFLSVSICIKKKYDCVFFLMLLKLDLEGKVTFKGDRLLGKISRLGRVWVKCVRLPTVGPSRSNVSLVFKETPR